MAQSFVLVAVAVILGAFAYRYATLYFPSGRRWVIGAVCAALAVALMVFVIINSVIDDLLEGAGGSGGFADNGLVRTAMFIGPTAVVGYGMWIWYRSRWPRD